MPRLVDLQGAFRSLLLPIAPHLEDHVLAVAFDRLRATGLRDEDQGLWILLEADRWREEQKPGHAFRRLVQECLREGDPSFGGAMGKRYFPLHAQLAAMPLFDHDKASAFLSHLRLMAALADNERLSAAQIAKVISARDRRIPVPWAMVDKALRSLGLGPSLDQGEVEALFQQDSYAEEEILADADIVESAEWVGEVGSRLAYPGALAEELLALAPARGDVHGPYLQMLHYLCVIAERYDYALSALYEFEPRSTKGPPQWLFQQYPAALNVSGNPFLNNSKSVNELDRAWAWSKKGAQVAPAHALVSVVEGLDSLGFAARKDLAAWIRRWLCRRIRLAKGQSVMLPSGLTDDQFAALMAKVPLANTKTRGIVEQRFVDALALLLRPRSQWIPLGVGDSVNTNNLSRRKCGDADFQDVDGRQVVAYEAHAGVLTDLYIREHCRTLRPILRARRAEWDANIGQNQNWTVEVVFVAHELDLSLDSDDLGFDEGATEVFIRPMTYSALVEEVMESQSRDDIKESITKNLLDVMSGESTPDRVRSRLLELVRN